MINNPPTAIGSSLRQYNNILKVKTESGEEEVYYPVFHEDLPKEFKNVLEETLGETPSEREKGLQRLKKFMQKENLSATEDQLISVLRACKYDVKKSESKLKGFLKARQHIIKLLSGIHEEKIKIILSHTMFTVLPYRDKHGRAVLVTKPTVDFDQYTPSDMEPIAMALGLYLLTFPMTTVCGLNLLMECKCDSILVFYPLIKNFRPYVYYSINLPVRIGRIDIVNENVLVKFFYYAIRPLLPTKLKNRILFNGYSYESLHSVYHRDVLPQDMEGHLRPLSDEFYRERLMQFIVDLKREGLEK